jgi:hypothetical protein
LFYSDAAYYDGEEAYNVDGLPGATYILAAPEPSAWALALIAIGGVFYLRRWRQNRNGFA